MDFSYGLLEYFEYEHSLQIKFIEFNCSQLEFGQVELELFLAQQQLE